MSIIDQAAANQVSGQLSNLINGAAYRLAGLMEDGGPVDQVEAGIRDTKDLLGRLRLIRQDFENACAGLPDARRLTGVPFQVEVKP